MTGEHHSDRPKMNEEMTGEHHSDRPQSMCDNFYYLFQLEETLFGEHSSDPPDCYL
jgi:hypothetical protein